MLRKQKIGSILSKKRPGSFGFTIIEIMIVLAIAALILLIVLLAVPAAKRASDNLRAKHDATALFAAIQECMTNNGDNEAYCAIPANIPINPATEFDFYTGFWYGTNNTGAALTATTSPPASDSVCDVYAPTNRGPCSPDAQNMNYEFDITCNTQGTWFLENPNGTTLVTPGNFVVTYLLEDAGGTYYYCTD